MSSPESRTYIKIITLSTPAKLAQQANHDLRIDQPANADPTFTMWNRTLKPLPPGETVNDAWNRVAGGATRRADAVYVSIFMINIPKAWVAQKCDKEVNELADSTTQFLDKCLQERVLYGVMHWDELSPHFAFAVVPLHLESNRVAQRRLFDESGIRKLNAAYYEKVLKGYGLAPAFSGSRPTHSDIRAFDAAVKQDVTLIEIRPEDIERPGTYFTDAAKEDFRKKIATDVTRLANEQNKDVAVKAKAVGIYYTKVADLEKLVYAKERFIGKLNDEHEVVIANMQKDLAAEKADALKFRQLATITVDPGELLVRLGFRPQITPKGTEFHGVGDLETVRVHGSEAFVVKDQKQTESPITHMELVIKATGWGSGRCHAYLHERYGFAAVGLLAAYGLALAAKTGASVPEINLAVDESQWPAVAAQVPTAVVTPEALKQAHHEGKVVADTQRRLNFWLLDESKQVGGFLVYEPAAPATPLREFRGGPNCAFAMGSPGAPTRVICALPWQVMAVQDAFPRETAYSFCGTQEEPPIDLLLFAPKDMRLMSCGFPAGSPALAKLSEKLTPAKLAELKPLELAPMEINKAISRPPPVTSYGSEHGRIERDEEDVDLAIPVGVFALGSPEAPMRVICEEPWQVRAVQDAFPGNTAYSFCGTSVEPPIDLLLSAPKGVQLRRCGFAAGSPAADKLAEKLTPLIIAELRPLELDPVAFKKATPQQPSAPSHGGSEGYDEGIDNCIS